MQEFSMVSGYMEDLKKKQKKTLKTTTETFCRVKAEPGLLLMLSLYYSHIVAQ